MSKALPPLPEPSWPFGCRYNEKDMRAYAIAAIEAQGVPDGWQPIETAPKDGTPILGWCVHKADPYFLNDGTLTIYGAHTEELSHVDDGINVVVWSGAFDESTYEYEGARLPDWWFRADSDFEVTANPTRWMPLPAAPSASAPPAPQAKPTRKASANFDLPAPNDNVEIEQSSVVQREPVFNGWYCAHCKRGVDGFEVTFHEKHTVCGRVITEDVPPAQQAKQPLTDEQIREAVNGAGMVFTAPDIKVARAIEAAHGIKGK